MCGVSLGIHIHKLRRRGITGRSLWAPLAATYHAAPTAGNLTQVMAPFPFAFVDAWGPVADSATRFDYSAPMRLSIATKVFVAFAVVIVVFTMVLMFGIYRTQATYSQIQTVSQTVVPLSLLLSDVQTDLKSFNLVLNERDPLVLRRTLQVTRLGPSMPERFRTKIAQAEKLANAVDLGAEQTMLDGARAQILELNSRINVFAQDSAEFAELALATTDDTREVTSRQETLRDEARAIDEQLTLLRRELQGATDRGLARAKDVERSSLYALSASAVAALAVAILLLVGVLVTIRRLTALTEATKRIGDGDYQPLHEVAHSRVHDEIEELREEFDAMARRLRDRDDELREQHAQLLRSERLAAIGRMTSLITHELRNPLSSINLNTEMLFETLSESGVAADDPEVIPVLETIIAEVDRLRDITEEYLVYARLPAPKVELENVVDILQNLVDFHATEWLGDDVNVQLDVPDGALLIEIDPNQVRQAVLNLMRNAVEASPPGTLIRITAKSRGDTVVITVADAGPGIAPDLLAHIFDPFFTTKSSGTGLGLAMTQQIVEENRGVLSVESTLGVGTTFHITFHRGDG